MGDALLVGFPAQALADAGSSQVTADPYFAAAVAAPSTAQSVIFVDLTKIWDGLPAGALPDDQLSQWKNVAAVGLSTTQSSDGMRVELRVVIR